MSGSLNLCQFIGNLGRDPDIRSMGDGGKVCNLSIACTDTWRDKSSGERRERTEWVRAVLFNERLIDVAEKYCRKGSKVYISGAMQTRKWTDQSGQERYTTEVVLQRFRGELTLLDGPKDRQEDGAGAPPLGRQGGGLDDEIPFAPLRELP